MPGPNDDVDVEAPNNITVDSVATIQYIYGGGTITMGANSTLVILDNGGTSTYQIGTFDTSAPGNTVIYAGNPFYAKHQNYNNLVFSNTVTPSLIDFYNGFVNPQDPSAAMTIAGNMTVMGRIKVQQGDDFTINGNLILGTNSQWDCSSFALRVGGLTTLNGGLMLDLNGALGTNVFGGGMVVNGPGGGWNVSDVTQWAVNASLTNNGIIGGGKGYGSITFNGAGTVVGTAFKIPTMTVNGTTTIRTTVTLSTNTPTLNGTLVFDIANPQKIILQPGAGTALFYSGNLNVINSGAPPASGATYKFFDAPSYGGAFAAINFPPLPGGLSWVDNLLTTGSISVTGSAAGAPALSYARSGNTLTLSWDSATFPGYRVQGQTNSAGIGTNWGPTTSGTTSPFTISINPANPPVFFRLINP